jgi:hypothetical protein
MLKWCASLRFATFARLYLFTLKGKEKENRQKKKKKEENIML